MFKVGLYDDQPNKTTGSGIGPAKSFSDFRVSGMRGTIPPLEPFQAATAPEPSTWAMMLAGFAGLGIAGYRQSNRQRLATVP